MEQHSRKDDENEEKRKRGNIWLIVFSDMTTNLMLFFLLLFATTVLSIESGVDKEEINREIEEAFALPEEKKQSRETQEKLDDAIAQLSEIKELSGIEVGRDEIKLRLPSSVLFDLGKAELKDGSRKIIFGLGNILADLSYQIVVEGHTCNLPIIKGKTPYRTNWELSAARALSVVDFLIEKGMVEPQRLAASGLGSFNPLLPNINEENRAQNRRIEIKIITKEKETL